MATITLVPYDMVINVHVKGSDGWVKQTVPTMSVPCEDRRIPASL